MKKLLLLALLGSALGLIANDGAGLYKKCMSCHGINGEKKALGKSQVIKGWDASKTLAALKGYKEGTYGGTMKALMKGQVAPLNDADMDAIAKYIQTLK